MGQTFYEGEMNAFVSIRPRTWPFLWEFYGQVIWLHTKASLPCLGERLGDHQTCFLKGAISKAQGLSIMWLKTESHIAYFWDPPLRLGPGLHRSRSLRGVPQSPFETCARRSSSSCKPPPPPPSRLPSSPSSYCRAAGPPDGLPFRPTCNVGFFDSMNKWGGVGGGLFEHPPYSIYHSMHALTFCPSLPFSPFSPFSPTSPRGLAPPRFAPPTPIRYGTQKKLRRKDGK